MANSSRLVEFIFYSIFSFAWILTAYLDQWTGPKLETVGIKFHLSFGKRMKYLTFIDMNLQAIYFTLCFINVFVEYFLDRSAKDMPRYLRKFTNFLYTTMIFPAGFFVTITFWSIYLIDRELIYPSIFDTVLPAYRNHLVHTLPLVSVFLESLVTKHKYESSFIKGVFPTLLYSAVYFIWVLIVAFYGNIWVYPILEILTTIQRALFFAGLLFFASLSYKSGQLLNSFIWASKKPEKKSF